MRYTLASISIKLQYIFLLGSCLLRTSAHPKLFMTRTSDEETLEKLRAFTTHHRKFGGNAECGVYAKTGQPRPCYLFARKFSFLAGLRMGDMMGMRYRI